MDFPSGSVPMWDMDFKGQWEMDRDLISEFIQQQHRPKIVDNNTRSVEANSTNQVEQAFDESDDANMMKFLPMKLMDDDAVTIDGEKLKEAQSISSLESKFDANVKALWNDVDDSFNKPSTLKSFEESNASLVSSFSSEKNSLSLFNFSGQQPHQVIAPCNNLQLYSNADFTNITDFDCNNNSGRGAVFNSHHSSASTISPGAEKFIKSGTNLQSSIWSDGEFNCESESLAYKDVSIVSCTQSSNASRS